MKTENKKYDKSEMKLMLDDLSSCTDRLEDHQKQKNHTIEWRHLATETIQDKTHFV